MLFRSLSGAMLPLRLGCRLPVASLRAYICSCSTARLLIRSQSNCWCSAQDSPRSTPVGGQHLRRHGQQRTWHVVVWLLVCRTVCALQDSHQPPETALKRSLQHRRAGLCDSASTCAPSQTYHGQDAQLKHIGPQWDSIRGSYKVPWAFAARAYAAAG